MNNVWTEEAIRKELARLDAKAGFNGAKLPISFSNVKGTHGIGVIEEIMGESINRCITVNFDSVGCKRLGLAWVDKNCRKCP